MTGFAKRGLPHTSNSMNLEDYNLDFKAHTNLKFSTSINLQYVGTHCCPNFKAMAVFNLKLLITKVDKLDVCGRPLFANPVTNIVVLHIITYKVQQHESLCKYIRYLLA